MKLVCCQGLCRVFSVSSLSSATLRFPFISRSDTQWYIHLQKPAHVWHLSILLPLLLLLFILSIPKGNLVNFWFGFSSSLDGITWRWTVSKAKGPTRKIFITIRLHRNCPKILSCFWLLGLIWPIHLLSWHSLSFFMILFQGMWAVALWLELPHHKVEPLFHDNSKFILQFVQLRFSVELSSFLFVLLINFYVAFMFVNCCVYFGENIML